MDIDGKTEVKERKLIYKGKYFNTYRYEFENGSHYNETVNTWQQTDFKGYSTTTPEEHLEKRIDKLVYGRFEDEF